MRVGCLRWCTDRSGLFLGWNVCSDHQWRDALTDYVNRQLNDCYDPGGRPIGREREPSNGDRSGWSEADSRRWRAHAERRSGSWSTELVGNGLRHHKPWTRSLPVNSCHPNHPPRCFGKKLYTHSLEAPSNGTAPADFRRATMEDVALFRHVDHHKTKKSYLGTIWIIGRPSPVEHMTVRLEKASGGTHQRSSDRRRIQEGHGVKVHHAFARWR